MVDAHADLVKLTPFAETMKALVEARFAEVTTETEHRDLLRYMGQSEDALVEMMSNPFAVPAEHPYTSLLKSLKKAVADKIISPDKMKQLVERLKASTNNFGDLSAGELKEKHLRMIDDVFPEYATS